MPLRAMEFRSVDEGGGVIDPDVPLDDVRLKWGNSGDTPLELLQGNISEEGVPAVTVGHPPATSRQ